MPTPLSDSADHSEDALEVWDTEKTMPGFRTFPYAREDYISYNSDLQFGQTICLPCFLPCHYLINVPNLVDFIDATHVAVTAHDVVRVRTKRKEGCRTDCEEAGETRDTVAVDQIQDIGVVLPAGGGFCFDPKKILTVRESKSLKLEILTDYSLHFPLLPLQIVNITTASGSALTINGLQDASGFVDCVKSLQQAAKGGQGGPQPMAMSRDENAKQPLMGAGADVLQVLHDIDSKLGELVSLQAAK
jgi:hypothetical protein